MPGMSGLKPLPKARAVRPDVPIIMITAYGDAETKRKALEGGAEAMLTKPIDFGTLRSEIDMRLNAPHNFLEFGAVHESGSGPSRHLP
jgi:DNA-binding response OmpR family regulator